MKISEAFNMLERNMRVRNFSPSTIYCHQHAARTLIGCVGDIDIKDLSTEDVVKWIDDIRFYRDRRGRIRRACNNTIRSNVERLRAVLKFAELNGIPCLHYELVPAPRIEPVSRTFLTKDEVKTMVDCAGSVRNKLIISLLFSSGIRLAELVSLDRESIKDSKFSIIGKGKKERLCFIDNRTQKLLDTYLEQRHDKCPALFISELYCSRLGRSAVQRIVREAAERAGINRRITPHILRHSFATDFIDNNGDIRTLSVLMGHTNLATTAIYTHVVDNQLEEQYRRFHSTF